MTEPSAHVLPGSHTMHAVAPSLSMYVPTSQELHCWLPVALANVPLLHLLGATRPPAHQLPAGHGSQLDWLSNARPSFGRYVPSSHDAGIRALEPGGHW